MKKRDRGIEQLIGFVITLGLLEKAMSRRAFLGDGGGGFPDGGGGFPDGGGGFPDGGGGFPDGGFPSSRGGRTRGKKSLVPQAAAEGRGEVSPGPSSRGKNTLSSDQTLCEKEHLKLQVSQGDPRQCPIRILELHDIH